jgi:hypothetical protein
MVKITNSVDPNCKAVERRGEEDTIVTRILSGAGKESESN